jgi:hypothetical protein
MQLLKKISQILVKFVQTLTVKLLHFAAEENLRQKSHKL